MSTDERTFSQRMSRRVAVYFILFQDMLHLQTVHREAANKISENNWSHKGLVERERFHVIFSSSTV